MKAEDFDNFRAGVSGVYGFYGKEVSSFALDIWWTALNGFELDAVKQAFNLHVVNPDTGQFPPKPADIVKMLHGNSQDLAYSAWTKVDKAVRLVGPYKSVVFDDPIIHTVVSEMGGWINLCSKNIEEWPFIAREFENRYRGYSIRKESGNYPSKLVGICETENLRKNHPVDEPTLIGNPDNANKILSSGSDGCEFMLTKASELICYKNNLSCT